MKKRKANHKASPKTSHIHNTTTKAQRERLLSALIELGSVNTMYARDKLNILCPAARIIELREQGHNIHTDRITITDRDGRVHTRVARYVLLQLAQEMKP